MDKLMRLKERIESYIGERTTVPLIPNRIFGYYKKIETAEYVVYEPSRGSGQIIAAYNNMVVLQSHWNPNKLTLYPYYQNRHIKYHIQLEKSRFPDLIPGSKVMKCMLLPYLRVVSPDHYQKSVRLIVITDKAQIYHNFPARAKECDGFSNPGDILRFEESVVWDVPGRKYPTPTKTNLETERYYPNLPAECYCYHPRSNDDPLFRDLYHNGGFSKQTAVLKNGKNVMVSRFYIHRRVAQANPFHFIGTGESEYKMSLIATYRSNVDEGVRTCIFVSTDGGRQWYCKYEFADNGEYDFQQGHSGLYGRNFGNSIVNNQYTVNDAQIILKKRELIIPSVTEKDPVQKFKWIDCGIIQSIEDEKELIVKTLAPHRLSTGNIIALCGNENSSSNMAWMFNPDVTENSDGNGLLFKVEVVDDHKVKLYELVSSTNNNIPCRHIHHVNRIKDGWMIGTGEIYPNGWLFYFQLKVADTFTPVNAKEEFTVIRMNSTEMSVQRTMGAILTDEPHPRLIYASDHDLLEREEKQIVSDRKNSYMRNSTGIFSCAVEDLDDRRKHRLIFEASEPCFYFQQLAHSYLFCGQRGEIGISFDNGLTWKREHIQSPIIHYYGNNGQRYYFDSCIIIRK